MSPFRPDGLQPPLFTDGFKKGADFVDTIICVRSNKVIISDCCSEQLEVAMETAGAIDIAQETVKEVGRQSHIS